MDPLGDPQPSRRIETGWEISPEPCPNWPSGLIDYQDCQFGNVLVSTPSWTWTGDLERLHKLVIRFTGWLRSSELSDTLVCSSQGSLEVHLEAMIVQDGRRICRFSFWRGLIERAWRVLKFNIQVSQLAMMDMRQVNSTVEETCWAGLWRSNSRAMHTWRWTYMYLSRYNHDNQGRLAVTVLGGCCTGWMMCLMYPVIGVNRRS